MNYVVPTLILMLACCAADVQPVTIDADAGAYEPELPDDVQPDAGHDDEPLGAAGAAGGAAGAAGTAPVQPQPAGAPADPTPQPVAGAAGGAAGAAGAAVQPPPAGAAGAPAPVQPVRFCRVNAGQRFAGQMLGCDAEYSRTSFPYLVLRWKVRSTAAASGWASVGCSDQVAHPCTTGDECRLDDSRDDQPTQYGVCL